MRKIIFFSVVILLLVISGYIYFSYYRAYDDGEKNGILNGFSRKGNVFKTNEGVILLPGGIGSAKSGGLQRNEFHFSVSDEAIADSLKKCVGMQVLVHYNQYPKSLPWRGESYPSANGNSRQFVVDRIISVTPAPNAYNGGI